MFDQINYFFGYASIRVLIVYLFYINLGFFLFGFIGLFSEKVASIRIPSVVKILVGYVVYTSLAWWLYRSGNSTIILPVFALMVIIAAVYFLLTHGYKNIFSGVALSRLLNFLRELTPLFVIELVVVGFWVGFLNDKPYNILVAGNNDVYFWGFMADHVMGISDLGRINGGSGNLSAQVIDCFGVYSWLGLIGKISLKNHSIEAVMLFQLSLSVISAWIIYDISAGVIGVTRLAAFVPAFVFSFNPLWVYIFSNNFLSQITATSCFLSSIYIIGLSGGSASSIKNNVLAGLVLFVSFLFSYPGLLVPYIAFLLGAIVVFNYFLSRVRRDSLWKEMGITMLGVGAGMLLGALFFFDIASHAISRFAVLSSVSAGWPLSMLDARNLIGLVGSSLDKTPYSNWITYFLLVTLIVTVLIFRNLSPKKQSLSDARYNSLLALAIIAIVGYLGVYYLKGDGYQHWKFATYFPLPLLLLVVVNYFAPKRHV